MTTTVLLGLFLSGILARALGADSTVFPMTNTYLKVMLLFAPAFLTNNLLQCFVRNDGKPTLSMTAMISGSLFNVIFDYLFIFPLHMGIFGAILATGFAPVISIIVLLPYFIGKKNGFHFMKSVPNIRRALEIISSGIPSFVTATYFTSTEGSRPAQIISFLRGLFVLVPVAFLLSAFLKMTGVWLAYPITECVVQ